MSFSQGLKNEFETAVVNERSVFEPLKFYCIYNYTLAALRVNKFFLFEYHSVRKETNTARNTAEKQILQKSPFQTYTHNMSLLSLTHYRLFHCHLLDKSICHFRGVWVYFVTFIPVFLWKILLANTEDPDQMPHCVASDLGLHYLPMTLLWFPSKNGLSRLYLILLAVL